MACSHRDWGRFLPPFGNHGFRSAFAEAFAGHVVCVAGAGGYLGSALVKALAPESPRSLILLDSSEHGLFEIQQYLAAAHPALPSQAILGSMADAPLLDDVFGRFRPRVVFHAAAFKHVGLLEQNVFAAIGNNVLGSYVLTQTALRHGVSKLVLVSTDKAVRPHSVMGVSKRMAELLTVSFSERGLRANAIRLCNVIGSTGSVVPIFLECIDQGRPLCVTHPDANRYFLSTDEAVMAILAAGSADCNGKILLPNAGEPVNISELAQFLLAQKSNVSEIRFTGLRPGEKMTEDLFGDREMQTGIIAGPLTVWNTPQMPRSECDRLVQRLSHCLAHRDRAKLIDTLCSIVPEYVPSVLMREGAVALSEAGT